MEKEVEHLLAVVSKKDVQLNIAKAALSTLMTVSEVWATPAEEKCKAALDEIARIEVETPLPYSQDVAPLPDESNKAHSRDNDNG